MNELSGMLLCGGVLLIPVVMFALGYAVGADKLPFKVRVERNKKKRFAVEDSHDPSTWQ